MNKNRRDEILGGLMLVAFVVVVVLALIQGGDSRVTTSRGLCENRWERNKSTAESPYMTKERYISNCMETNRDLSDGRLDGR